MRHEQHTIYVVRLQYIGDKAAVQNDPLDARTNGQAGHPAYRLHLHTPQFGLATEALLDLPERRAVDTRRKAAGVVEGRDH